MEQGPANSNVQFHSNIINSAIEEAISPSELAQALAEKPFVSVPGTFNLRDLAHIPHVRPNLIFRSGTLAGLKTEGKDDLVNNLRIRTVFDLRSAGELKAFPFPDLTSENSNIEVRWAPSDTTMDEVDINDFVELASEGPGSWNGGARGFSKQYLEVLRSYKSSFQKVFQHLLDRPGEAILFNCTAGKDRTGTLAALILSVAGVPDDQIAFDYALSRIGIEPQKAQLTAFVKWWKPDWTPETPGMKGFSNVRAEYMIQFLQDAKSVYAGDDRTSTWATEYLHTQLGFSKDDIGNIRENLRA
jgi:protein tyrosine/serine phosphatase